MWQETILFYALSECCEEIVNWCFLEIWDSKFEFEHMLRIKYMSISQVISLWWIYRTIWW